MERIREKLSILADAAKYDVSCSSSGSKRKNTDKGIGDASNGICHTYTEDGRCVSLLKILLTNYCIYDCAFCVSRSSNDIKRAAFTVDEVVELTMNFYRRNYIEGLFLSSGIFKNADYTMERLLKIVKKLRTEERYNGYIHLKTIPGASEELINEAGLYVDRMSINLEMPTEEGLKKVAPEKSHEAVKRPLGIIQHKIQQFSDERKLIKHVPQFVPAGQSTQMVIGATPENDMQIMHTAAAYYKNFSLKRVYYSGYIPIRKDDVLPVVQPPLMREHRLYQTDWLLRFYGFKVDELLDEQHPDLDMQVDPKLMWALRNLHCFPVDINTADFQSLLRVPGIGRQSVQKIIEARKFGRQSVQKIIEARKFGRLRVDQLRKLGIAYNRAQYFIICADTPFVLGSLEEQQVRSRILNQAKSKYAPAFSTQLSLF